MLLPPLGYRADAARARALLRAPWPTRPALPLMLYNNPEASGVDLLPRGDRGGSRRRSSRSSPSRSARETCGGSRRCWPPRRSWRSSSGGDDWALEGFCAGATGWVTGVADVAPRECVALYEHCRAGELDAAREIYQRLLPLARFDMTPKLVQYFKAAHGRVRPRRRPVPRRRGCRSPTRSGRTCARARGAARGRARLRAARYLAAVDSHTEGMPTRVVTGGVGPIPGATMLERKLHFETEMDDLRLLLMREPRGHSAMSGAILQPPTRDGRRLGRAVHRGLGLPADVRARRRSASRPCSWRPGWSR